MTYFTPSPTYTSSDIAAAWDLITKAQKITLLTHKEPDADGASACAGLAHIFTKLGKQTETIYPTGPNRPLLFQAAHVSINAHTQIPDLIIVCDTASADRMYKPDAFAHIPLINIDHHISSSIRGTFNFINFAASSTCEELYVLLSSWDASLIDAHVARCLLYGILYDTQVFYNQGATAQTLRVSADLIDRGANLFELKNELITNKDPKICSLWGSMLSNITISANGKAAWVSVTQETLKQFGLKSPSLLGFSNFFAGLSGVDITIIFYESDWGTTEVSLRSRQSDVNALAHTFGGGGHKHAAGISSKKPMLELIKAITSSL